MVPEKRLGNTVFENNEVIKSQSKNVSLLYVLKLVFNSICLSSHFLQLIYLFLCKTPQINLQKGTLSSKKVVYLAKETFINANLAIRVTALRV